MADEADQAQATEVMHRQAALDCARCRHVEEQEYAGGRIVCRDCGEPIPAARLDILPTACRCVACQEEAEATC
ncbi:hypothetical protein DVDV_0110 [Desulfovibrio sp. DV]|uniref:TraR/DksA C4-type zinc finger protein n=1 Tax=Desulfovibrio sp. DV TaxID=1844708 RepID=UPI00094B7E58|nr:TraR/DksA C4-type zinc finger protein [Desulfovibrio sp. DV]OLN31322.1 hypothetical protein DVDV_0110 [Desulfovibrio sp. DV]